MPKSAGPGPHFNRSILVLTPERALKFTATTRERHYVWLNALSFLSHSPLSLADLAALPPPPQDEPVKPPPPSLAGSLQRRTIRDSILMMKASRSGQRSVTSDAVMQSVPNYGADDVEPYDPISDAALPPSIPRFSQHSRKRSNTAPRPPPSSFRSFSQKDSASLPRQSNSYSQSVTTGSDRGVYTPSLGMRSGQASRRGSEASATTGPAISRIPSASQINNYFENIGLAGTMKMDAFIENNSANNANHNANSHSHNTNNTNNTNTSHNHTANFGKVGVVGPTPSAANPGLPPIRPKGSYRTRQGWKKDIGYWGGGEHGDDEPVEMTLERFRSMGDPFRGF